jgi:formate--tetrahydrofolate ligase
MLSDIEIAQAAHLKPIQDVAKRINLSANDLIPYGHHIAKVNYAAIDKLQKKPDGKLILVTAISPTPAGEGKTTTTVGLTDALNKIGKHAMVCIREPSLGPVFGMKGGATGGGYAQVVPMENINLHFTGDFHAIAAANNLLAALIDNHIHHGNSLSIDLNAITWRRCMDMNDRALRKAHLYQLRHETDTGFDITVASEIMAVFCLAENLADLKERIGNIQVAKNVDGKAILASDLKAEGALAAILKDAFQPNLVQTIESNPAMIHGGPFANIAHGCNSVIATKTALKLADYVVTEAGFGADLGAEKFFDIKCRQTNLKPDAVVLVATIRALKYHGGAELDELNIEGLDFLSKGISNLKRHIDNIQQSFGMQVIVAINHFTHDSTEEINLLKNAVKPMGCEVLVCKHWAEGSLGAIALAEAVVKVINHQESNFKLLYKTEDSLPTKLEIIAKKLYGAKEVSFSDEAELQMRELVKDYNHLPVCVAKTQYSFSSDPTLRNAPSNHTLKVRELRLSRGAGFIVAICGDIMTMPGLPKTPASERITVDSMGVISGLS